jgi:transposase
MTIPIEIRKLVVNAYCSGAGSYDFVAGLFGIGSASVKRLVRLKRETNSVEPLAHSGGVQHLIDDKGLGLIKQWIEERPDIGLEELTVRYNKMRMTTVSVSTIGRSVRGRLKLRRKKRVTGPSSRTRHACRD